jgi:hypothetical protein
MLPIAQVAELDGCAGSASGDISDQIVTVLDRATVDGGDYVSGLEASFIGWEVWLYTRYQYAVFEAINTADGT